MNTILFDLDGTLLPMDLEEFEKLYFYELGKACEDLIPTKDLVALIWSSTKEMVKNTDLITNEEVFMGDFANRVQGKMDLFKERFDRFYTNSFDNVRKSTKVVPSIRESVKILKDKGYNLVLATNPLFPEEAVYKRIEWAGFKAEDFCYISTFEKNHFCKPQIKYYQEILEDINKKPEDCLMVGNDVQEDLIAKRVGIKTYLITDHLINRDEAEIVSDYSGTYNDFLNFVNLLPPVNN